MIYPGLKRVIDVVVSATALIVLSPLLLGVAILIRVGDPGPALYVAPRVGRGGRIFGMYKFRTMVRNADRIGGSSTPDDDPRLTQIGRTLRRYKLDELPQLINVVKGDMSIVGPRPQVEWAVNEYSEAERRVLEVRPGITDYASLRFPNEGEILKGSPDPDRDYMERIHPEKMRLSLEYLDRRSLAVDIGIIIRTAATILKVRT